MDPLAKQDSMLESIDSECLASFEFSEFHGKHVQLVDDKKSAVRISSYNQGVVCLSKPLCKGQSVSIKITQVHSKWSGTISVGAIGVCPGNSFVYPSSAILFKRPCWILSHDFFNLNGTKTSSKYGDVLNQIQAGTVITLSLTMAGNLCNYIHIFNRCDL